MASIGSITKWIGELKKRDAQAAQQLWQVLSRVFQDQYPIACAHPWRATNQCFLTFR
jgi:hypothetical protein